MLEVKVRLSHSNAYTPTVNHEGDAGMDFYSLEDYIIHSFSYKIARTGVSVEFPEGFVGLLKPKSKNDHLIGAGVVDYTYEGEILFKIFNPLDYDRVIAKGDPIGQMIFVKNESPKVIVTDKPRMKTARGTTGGIVVQLANGPEQLNLFKDKNTYDTTINRWD